MLNWKCKRISRPSLDSVLVKKSVMAKLAGLTVPALKKRLSSAAYCEICENPYYENTLTQVGRLSVALAELGIDDARRARGQRQLAVDGRTACLMRRSGHNPRQQSAEEDTK